MMMWVALAILVVALAVAVASPVASLAASPDGHENASGDILPYAIIHGRPDFQPDSEVGVYLWSEGGRLHLRILPGAKAREVVGELRVSTGGAFRDVAPLSENLRVRQPNPWRMGFDVQSEGKPEGLDVALAGDFEEMSIDIHIDGVRMPKALHIGQQRERPHDLPAHLHLDGAAPGWIERFGFGLP